MFTKIQPQIQKTIDYYRQHNLFEFIKHFFRKLGFENFSKTVIFIILDVSNIPNDIKKPYSFSPITIDEMQNDEYYSEYFFTKREIIGRLQKGHRLFELKENDKLAYLLWVEQGNVTITDFKLPLHIPRHMAYISGGFTAPEFRNRGIASKLKKEILCYLKKQGVKQILGVVSPSNTTALLIDKKLGFKEYQTLNYKRYWHLRHYAVQKFNSDERKTFITIFKPPKNIWKTFL